MNASGNEPAYLELTLGGFLDLSASRTPAPGGGAALAVTVALAASLSGMAARFSADHLPEAAALAGRSDSLRDEAAALAQADATAYERVLAAKRGGGEDRNVREALSDAADVPLAVAEIGSEVAEIAVRIVERGNPNLRGDAVAAALLAEAGVRAAATLAEINLSGSEPDERLERAGELVQTAAAARRVAEDG